MKIIRGIKIGGLQQKIFNLMLVFLIALVGSFAAVNVYQQRNLSGVVQTASEEQQRSISEVSETTMESVLETSMTSITELQSHIADDLFGEVRSDVMAFQTFAKTVFENSETFPAHPYYAPDRDRDGIATVQLIHAEGVDPEASGTAGLIANMGDVMLSMFNSSDKIGGLYIGTADGLLLFVNDRSGAYVDDNGKVMTLDVTSRPWYTRAARASALVYTDVEADAYTGIATITCAAPVYAGGKLVAVVGADIFLTSISDYVDSNTSDGSFLCVVNENGKVLFSPKTEGTFRASISAEAEDLRQSENDVLAEFVRGALRHRTGLESINVDGKDYYFTGAPMKNVTWTVISAVEKEVTYQPTAAMLSRYDAINEEALSSYRTGAQHSAQTMIVLTVILVLIAILAALYVAGRVVKPVEHMTRRINGLGGSDTVFEMENIYCTGDEIEVLAESFASLSKKTRDYIDQITEITAEKERIGTELALATRIQADMLPNIYPAFPDRKEFDIYACMDPAREVGGDFYDFFLIDDDHLCMLIADVSGKGVPAALFMMASRIILASNAKQGKSPAEILRATNETICQNNREEMFVTVWLGILEISTGRLTAANAGHEYPVLRRPGGKFELIKDKHGFVIGSMEGMKYHEYELLLEPGSRLFVYTDGVPEATSAENELFGTERMLGALNENGGKDPQEMLANMRSAVDRFVKDAEQFDDLTMLGFEYMGPVRE